MQIHQGCEEMWRVDLGVCLTLTYYKCAPADVAADQDFHRYDYTGEPVLRAALSDFPADHHC